MATTPRSAQDNPSRVHDHEGFRNDDSTLSPGQPGMDHASSTADSVQERPPSSEDPANTGLARVRKRGSFLERCRRKAWLLPIIHTHFWYAACFSLLGPYFSMLAVSRGLPAWNYGFVFLSFKIAMLIGSVFAERLMTYLKPSTVYLTAQGGYFFCSLAFGILYWSPGGDVLLGLAITFAIFGGFFAVTYSVSVYSIVIERFTGNSGIIIATFVCLWGIGSMTGPILGGVLIRLWDHPVPFFVIGAIMMLSFPVIAKRGPIPKGHRRVITDNNSSEQVEYCKAICDPVFLTAMVTVMLSGVIFGFNELTLAAYLHQVNLTTTEIGSVFLAQCVSYCLGAVPVGIICDRDFDELFMFIGQSLTAIAYLILGPAPFLPVAPSLWMIYPSQVLTGFGLVCQFVSSYSLAHKRLLKKGYPDTVRTSGFVSTCFYTFLVFGSTAASRIAGFVVERLGYRTASLHLFSTLTLWAGVTFVVWLNTVYCNGSSTSGSDISPKPTTTRRGDDT
ncbi:MFS-type transporter SLC18B1-like [Ornithodoros turicata]|uniref:MFS-type transporter SLC18B1-like n=1 Tax=Ornithodoros turicata TaxID=34597 RepID=UPI0031397783